MYQVYEELLDLMSFSGKPSRERRRKVKKSIKRAIRLFPNEAILASLQSHQLAAEGKLTEAFAETERALELNPVYLEERIRRIDLCVAYSYDPGC